MLLGAFLYCIAVNEFVVPMGLYSGGFVGFAQLIRTFLAEVAGIRFEHIEIASVIFYVLNIPGMILARRIMGRLYLIKTLIAVTTMTIIMALLPQIHPPIMGDDILASCIVGGLLGGAGIGLILRSGASDGGMDIVGVLLLHWKKGLSVGKVNIAFNCILYGIMFFVFDWHVVIYSLICAAVNAFTIDRVYAQNINMEVHIITAYDSEALEKHLMRELDRGVTRWSSVGAYSGTELKVLYCIVNKYEIRTLRTIVNEHDPHAFVVSTAGVQINGNFARHLS